MLRYCYCIINVSHKNTATVVRETNMSGYNILITNVLLLTVYRYSSNSDRQLLIRPFDMNNVMNTASVLNEAPLQLKAK